VKTVYQLHPQKTTVFAWHPSYTFEPRGWLKGFQHLAFWFLKKTKALPNYIGEETYITYHVIDDKQLDIINQFYQAKIEMLGLHNREPSLLIIGSYDFEKLVGMKNIQQYFNLYRDKILDIDVKVVPWITGWVMI
jgi:hypothetical protein